MQIELFCPCCEARFTAAPDTQACNITANMFEFGPWFPLGDGETFEDMIFNELTENGDIVCPLCDEPVHVNEESLSQLAQEMLSKM